MHVFLTGPVQIGKSTLIAAALDALQPERLGGFRTVSAKPEADGSRPVYLHPATPSWVKYSIKEAFANY